MLKVKNQEENTDKEESSKDLLQQISETVAGLTYVSETDAEILPFSGREEDFISKEYISVQQGQKESLSIVKVDFEKFFAPLVKTQKWFGEDERKMTEKFIRLKDLLQQNLHNLKVFKIGKKNIDYFVVGLDKDNILRGIQTKAVET